MFWMFAIFILGCGTTHLFGVIDLWKPLYRLDGIIKLVTALVSIITALALWPLIPKALMLPSPAQLEERVHQRTDELARANVALRFEIEARTRAEREREELLSREKDLRAQAEHANQMKDEFLATVSHELRTPLNAILGWTHLLRRRDGQVVELKEGLEVIDRSTRAQVRLIEDLLDVSRIVSGKLRLDVQPVNLADVIAGAVQAIEPAVTAKGLQVRKFIDPRAGEVTGDPGRLQQVVWNLLSNAVKFTPQGGQIDIRLARVNSHLEIAITDNGEGFPPQFLQQLFNRFQQLDSSITRRHGGLGLGLAIVRHIVELHGGSVTAHSAGLGHGAAFAVLLPLRVGRLEAAAGGAHLVDECAPRSSVDGILAGVCALAVDDDYDSRLIISRILSDAGARVLLARTAAEALELLTNEHPDVILCDIGMPGEDGYALLARIRLLSSDEGGATPAVAVTAFARSEDRTRAMRAGFQSHIAKPFDPGELVAAVANLAGRPT
jgi:signal transduction histidine kinase/CheY-like chemotaxis protein